MYYTPPSTDRIYIGQTNNISTRIDKHNSGKVKSTKAYIPWRLIHNDEFLTRSDAMKREKELKSHQGRNFIRENYLSLPLVAKFPFSNEPTVEILFRL